MSSQKSHSSLIYEELGCQVMDAARTYRWCQLALAALQRSEAAINALNVFPIADADTGTNMLLTWDAAAAAAFAVRDQYPGKPDEVRLALGAMARAAALVAMGSSGMILSQWLAGFAAGGGDMGIAAAGSGDLGMAATGNDAKDAVPAEGGSEGEFAAAIARANQSAWEAVADPVVGTILTVSDAAARAAEAAGAAPLQAAVVAARSTLAATAGQLPVHVRTGGVDAGAQGLVVILETLVAAGDPSATAPALNTASPAANMSVDTVSVDTSETPPTEPTLPSELTLPSEPERYEVQYLLLPDDDMSVDPGASEPSAVGKLRHRLAELGDSVVIGSVGQWREEPTPSCHVHVHVDAVDVGSVLDAGAVVGQLSQIRVTPLVESI